MLGTLGGCLLVPGYQSLGNKNEGFKMEKCMTSFGTSSGSRQQKGLGCVIERMVGYFEQHIRVWTN